MTEDLEENLSNTLLDLVEKVIQSSDERLALHILLSKLNQLFKMDQASFWEESQEGVLEPILSLSASGKIIQDPNELWLSQTLSTEALNTMSPIAHLNFQNEPIPKSVSEHSLKNVVCVPISRNPKRVIFLASQRDPFRKYSTQELAYLKTAAHAAFMGLQQNQMLRDLKAGNERLQTALQSQTGNFLTASRIMEKTLEEVAKIAPFNVSVLIQGESGSGKEAFAREIHRLSGRKGKFIAINCANLTESLLESELFGYVKGAFTGANTNKQGLFQDAHGGTFFLDEIAELPFVLQAKLLRVLQERCVRPVGGNVDIAIDVRILAASHTELPKAVSEKLFREDLYYRIQEMTVEIPPLRKRPEDIELMSHHFVAQFVAEFNLPPKTLSPGAIQKLLNHSWPGNVRELKNCCRTSVILAASGQIQDFELRMSSEVKPEIKTNDYVFESAQNRDLKTITQKFELALTKDMLERPGETQVSVAKNLGISVRTLQRIIGRDPDLKSVFDPST